MKIGITLVFLVFILLSCEFDDTEEIIHLPVGTYKGQFLRTSPHAKYAPSNVTLTFTVSRFSGESDRVKNPAICNGSYRISGHVIEFTNECPWTAEFDWTYILNGKFVLSLIGNQLEMTKYMDGHTDYYRLTLQ